jgi:enoyl-CoA hydratase/carnithine racemase
VIKPVIAAINGPAVGVGVTMTLPMDIRLVAESAKLGFVFARRGIVPEACSSVVPAPRGGYQPGDGVGHTGRVFDAEEALEGGLVRSIHDPTLLDGAYGLAREIAEHTSPPCRWR